MQQAIYQTYETYPKIIIERIGRSDIELRAPWRRRIFHVHSDYRGRSIEFAQLFSKAYSGNPYFAHYHFDSGTIPTGNQCNYYSFNGKPDRRLPSRELLVGHYF